MRRKYTGLKINFDMQVEGESRFVVFGQMAEGMMCYHEIDENDEEIEGIWYSKSRVSGTTVFFAEGEE